MRRPTLAVLIVGPLLGALLVQCFSPELPECSFRCDTPERACPEDYECREDSYCHRVGSRGTCPYGPLPDMTAGPDLRQVADAAMDGGTGDGGNGDGGGSDGPTDAGTD